MGEPGRSCLEVPASTRRIWDQRGSVFLPRPTPCCLGGRVWAEGAQRLRRWCPRLRVQQAHAEGLTVARHQGRQEETMLCASGFPTIHLVRFATTPEPL